MGSPPSVKPQGIEAAGWPLRLNGRVKRIRLKSLGGRLGPFSGDVEIKPGDGEALDPLFVVLRDRRALLRPASGRAPDLSYVVITSGSYDLLVEVVCEHNRHLLDVVQRLREIDGVKSTETFMYLDMVKMTYAWGTR